VWAARPWDTLYLIIFFSFCINLILLYFLKLEKAVLRERLTNTIVITKSLEDLKIRYRELRSRETTSIREKRKVYRFKTVEETMPLMKRK
jgi:hypothetical protein